MLYDEMPPPLAFRTATSWFQGKSFIKKDRELSLLICLQYFCGCYIKPQKVLCTFSCSMLGKTKFLDSYNEYFESELVV